MRRKIVVLAVLMGVFVASGCQSTPKRMLLPVPAGTNAAAVHHHDEGIQAYQRQQWESAKLYFQAAITASPAEAHYNLGMVLSCCVPSEALAAGNASRGRQS